MEIHNDSDVIKNHWKTLVSSCLHWTYKLISDLIHIYFKEIEIIQYIPPMFLYQNFFLPLYIGFFLNYVYEKMVWFVNNKMELKKNFKNKIYFQFF